MANAKFVLFDKDTDRNSQVKIKEGTEENYKNLMPQDHGMLLTDITFEKLVPVIKTPSVISPVENEEDFKGYVILSKYENTDRYDGENTGIEYQISYSPDFDSIISEKTVDGDTDRFTPLYGTEIDPNTKVYIRARYKSDENKSNWSDPIGYYKADKPEGSIIKPDVKLDWDGDTNIQQELDVNVGGFKLDPSTDNDEQFHTSTSYYLYKEDGTLVEALEKTEGFKKGYRFKNLEEGTKYKLKVVLHSEDYGDSEPTEITFTTSDTFTKLPDGSSGVEYITPDGTVLDNATMEDLLRNMKGNLREGYIGKAKTKDKSIDKIYRYVGEYNPDLNIFAATRDPSTGTPDYKLNETAYFQGDYISKDDELYHVLEDALPADPLDGDKFELVDENKIMLPNYGTILSLLAAINVYDRDEFTEEQLKYLCDFDYNNTSGKFKNSIEQEDVYKYDITGKKEVTAYFYPEKKDDEEQALREGNEYYCFVKDGVFKYVSTTYFKFVSPLELGMIHLVGEGRTIRVGHNLYRVSILSKEEIGTFNKLFNGELGNETPTYNDKDGERVLDIIRKNKTTLCKYEYHSLGSDFYKEFEPLSGRLFEDILNKIKYYPSFRIVLEPIHPDNEPWKGDKLAELNKDEPLEGFHSLNTSYGYNKFLDIGYYGSSNTIMQTYINCHVEPICTKQFGFNTQGQDDISRHLDATFVKFFYHGINLYYFTNITWNKISYQEVTDLGYLSMYPSSQYRETKLINFNPKNGNYNGKSKYIAAIPSNRKYLINNHVKKTISQENGSIIFNKNVNRSIYSELYMSIMTGYSSQFAVFDMYSDTDTNKYSNLFNPYTKFNNLEHTNRCEMMLGKDNTKWMNLDQKIFNQRRVNDTAYSKIVGCAILTNNLCASDDDGTQHYQNQVGTSADNCVVKKITSGNTNGYIGSAYHAINTNSARTAPHYYVSSTPRLKTKTDNLTAESNDQFFRKHNLQCLNMVLRLLTAEQTQEIEEFNSGTDTRYQEDYRYEIQMEKNRKEAENALKEESKQLRAHANSIDNRLTNNMNSMNSRLTSEINSSYNRAVSACSSMVNSVRSGYQSSDRSIYSQISQLRDEIKKKL